MRYQVIISNKGKEHNIILEADSFHEAHTEALEIATGSNDFINEEAGYCLSFPVDNQYEYFEIQQILEPVAPVAAFNDKAAILTIPFEYVGNQLQMTLAHKKHNDTDYVVVNAINNKSVSDVVTMDNQSGNQFLKSVVQNALSKVDSKNILILSSKLDKESLYRYLEDFISTVEEMAVRESKTAIASTLKDEEDK